MPPVWGDFDDTKDLFIEAPELGKKRVEPMHASTVIENSLCDLILDQKELGMKFKENFVVKSNAMYFKKIFDSLGNMQDIFKMNVTMRGCNN